MLGYEHGHVANSIGFLLTKAQWNAPALLAEKALDTLKTLGWKAGLPVDLVFDNTQKKKRGKQMDAVSKIFLHAEKVYAQGHTILLRTPNNRKFRVLAEARMALVL